MSTTFYELGVHHSILRGLQQMGFESATPIQEQVIPELMAGKDVIGQAQTGTGKTAAFGIPIIEKIDVEDTAVQALVLAPTRELAMQVSEEINKIARYKGVRSLAVYGGQEMGRQIRALKSRPQIIVATPGRLMDHMRRRTIRLANIKMVVLDEADEMLSMGFVEDIETILQEVPEERQTLLFSATMPKRLQAVTQAFMTEPTIVKVKAKEMTVTNIDQRYIELTEKQKFDALCHLLDIELPELAIVFGRTKRRVDELTEALLVRGYEVEGIHGDMRQERRDKVIRRFKNKTIDILVATDVAARGLDISGVTHVFNFDLPQDAESYVHRIGRTGRAGKAGVAFTFVTAPEMAHLRYIEETTKGKMTKQTLPTYSEALAGRYNQAVEKMVEIANVEQDGELRKLAERLVSEYEPVSLVMAALKLSTKERNETAVSLTSEPPARVKKQFRTKGKFDNKSSNRKGSQRYQGKKREREGFGFKNRRASSSKRRSNER